MFTESLHGTWCPLIQGKGMLLFFNTPVSEGMATSNGNSASLVNLSKVYTLAPKVDIFQGQYYFRISVAYKMT